MPHRRDGPRAVSPLVNATQVRLYCSTDCGRLVSRKKPISSRGILGESSEQEDDRRMPDRPCRGGEAERCGALGQKDKACLESTSERRVDEDVVQ